MTSDDLGSLKNIGPRMAEALAAAGIDTPEVLADLGAVEAWIRIRAVAPVMDNLMALYALEGALMDCEINAMPLDVIESLKSDAKRIRAAEKNAKRKPKR